MTSLNSKIHVDECNKSNIVRKYFLQTQKTRSKTCRRYQLHQQILITHQMGIEKYLRKNLDIFNK